MLFDIFKAVGPVLSIRVCRDAVTRRSLGYAYVNFQNPHDAERALETLNYQPVGGTAIRIMWSHRDPNLRKSGSGNIFIKNLDQSIDNQTLYDTFSQFGNILSCKVATDNSGVSRGYGFVHFEMEESAKAAIEKVNNMLLKGRQVFVGPFVRRGQRIAESALNFTNTYIKDFRSDVTVDQLVAFLSKFGPARENASTVKQDKKGRPFAFVDFAEHTAAKAAIEALHETHAAEICEPEQKLYIQRFQKKAEREEENRKRNLQFKTRRANDSAGSNLYVKNLEDTVTDGELKEAFARFGEITSVRVMFDDNNQSRGFGFVCFRNPENANKAIAEMNGFVLGTKPLYVNVAQRKDVRRAHLEIQYAARMGGRLPGNALMQHAPMRGPMMYQQPPPYFPRGGFPMPYGRFNMVPGAPYGPFPGARGIPVPGRMPPRAAPKRARAPAVGTNFPRATPATLPVISQAPIGFPPVAVIPPPPAASEPLSSATLAQMTPEEQKNALGERIFSRISPTYPEHAAKITGMLLEMDVMEQLHMLEFPELLQGKVNEALEVLKAHGTQ